MKARVKGTDVELEVHLVDKQARYIGSDGVTYWEEDLDFSIEDKNNPNYWTHLEHQAAIAAMQGGGVIRTVGHDRMYPPEKIAIYAEACAHALVEKIKEERT